MRRPECSIEARRDRPLDTIAATLEAAAARPLPGGRGRLIAPRVLQSWPGIVHGGAVLALCESLARTYGLPPLRTIEGRLTSSVPVETALDVEARADDGVVRLNVLDGGQALASCAVSPALSDDVRAAPAWTGGAGGWAVPTSEHCLACGTENPLGLHAAVRFDAEGVWVRLTPRPAWRADDGSLHPALAFVILDELAWWLGALVLKEGGVTNRLRVTFAAPGPAWSPPVIAAGRFDAVTPIDRRRAFWRTETALVAAGGEALATASIVFRGGAEYSSRQLPYFRARAGAELFGRMFPNYAG